MSCFKNPESGNKLIKKDNPDMEDAQIKYALKKMWESELLTTGPADDNGAGTIKCERWEESFKFMKEAKMVPADLDYKKAYTLEFLPSTPVKM